MNRGDGRQSPDWQTVGETLRNHPGAFRFFLEPFYGRGALSSPPQRSRLPPRRLESPGDSRGFFYEQLPSMDRAKVDLPRISCARPRFAPSFFRQLRIVPGYNLLLPGNRRRIEERPCDPNNGADWPHAHTDRCRPAYLPWSFPDYRLRSCNRNP